MSHIAIVNPILATPDIRPELVFEKVRPIPSSELRELHIVALGLALAELGNQVTIYVADVFLEAGNVAIDDRVTLRGMRPGFRRWFHPALYPFTPELLGSGDLREADVIQAGDFHQPATFFSVRAAAAAGIPLIVWQEALARMRFPGSLYNRGYEIVAGRFLRAGASAFVLRTTKAREYLLQLGVPPDRIGPWIPTGVDTTSFRPGAGRLRSADFSFPRDCRIVGMVTRLSPDKGVDLAIQAIALLRKKGFEVGLAIRGSGTDLPVLQALARRLGVDDRVRFVGRLSREQMVDFYNSADLLLSASRTDLLPFALLEGGACGRASVATRVGAVDDIVKDGRTGLLVRPNAPQELAEALSRLLRDEELRRTMGQEARRWISETFDMGRVAQHFLHVYQDVQDHCMPTGGCA